MNDPFDASRRPYCCPSVFPPWQPGIFIPHVITAGQHQQVDFGQAPLTTAIGVQWQTEGVVGKR